MPAFTVLGTDRQLGAIGLVESFRLDVIAEDADQAKGRAYRVRCTTRQDIRVTAVFEAIGDSDVETFRLETDAPNGNRVAYQIARGALEELRQISDALNAIDTKRCNEPCGPHVDEAEKKLERSASTLARGYGLRLIRQSDPRGRALAIATPRSHRFNGMGGEDAGWCI